MTRNSETKDSTREPRELIQNAADDLADRIEGLTLRLGDAADRASHGLRSLEDSAAQFARDLEPHAKRVLRATEDLAREAQRSVDRVVTGEKKRWYWPFK